MEIPQNFEDFSEYMNFNGIAKPSFLLLLKFFGKLQRNLNKIDVKLVENTTYFFLDLIISTKKDNFLLSLSAYHITGLVLARELRVYGSPKMSPAVYEVLYITGNPKSSPYGISVNRSFKFPNTGPVFSLSS